MTAYEMRISDWSSDVCSSDLRQAEDAHLATERAGVERLVLDSDLLDRHARLDEPRLQRQRAGEGIGEPHVEAAEIARRQRAPLEPAVALPVERFVAVEAVDRRSEARRVGKECVSRVSACCLTS